MIFLSGFLWFFMGFLLFFWFFAVERRHPHGCGQRILCVHGFVVAKQLLDAKQRCSCGASDQQMALVLYA